MYDIAKKARAGMKSKAERLAGEKDQKVDSSDWSPAEPLNADVKTGMRPVSRRAYKSGGKVEGCAPSMRADRKPRKAGGKVEEKSEQPLVDRYINRDLKKANEYRDGKKHVGALKHGGRAKKADGGSMTMEEMIKKNPAPAKKPLGLDKVPLPPRRPANLTPAANNPIKPDQTKYMTGDDITGPPSVRKNGGRAKHADGGKVKKSPWNMSASEMLESAKKRDEDTSKSLAESKKKYPGKSWIERAKSEMNEKFSPEYFAGLKAQRKKELSEDKGYQDFASRQSKKDSDDEMKKGGRVKKNDGGAMDPRLGIVKPKVMEFGQNLVTPGLKKGGRIAKQIGGALGMSANRMMPQLPPQAIANAQGVPMQGGTFAPPGLGNRPMMAAQPAMPIARASGGRAKSKGKTDIKIIIAAGAQPKPMVPGVPAAPMADQGAAPIAPINAAIMGAGSPPAAPMGGGQPPMPPMPPMPRKAGGRVSKVAHSYKDMTAGAGSGEGRLQKTDIAKRAPHKAGGKVYRSYKDMDAGAGSGEGRLEKTEIQKRKK